MTEPITIVLRLLDPTPLTDEELDEHMEWANTDTGTFVNFHHPLYVGLHSDPGPLGDDAPEEVRRLHELMDTRARLRAKHGYLHDDAPEDRPHRMIWHFERAYRPLVAYVLIRRGLYRNEPEELAELIIDLWTDTESPHRNPIWRELLAAFPVMEPHGDLGLLDPKGVTTVYRGVAIPEGSDPEEEHGYSWTTSQERAEWFANRFLGLDDRDVPVLLIGKVKNEDVLFCTEARGESEVVSGAVEVTQIRDLRMHVS